jgi:hypothetical protein
LSGDQSGYQQGEGKEDQDVAEEDYRRMDQHPEGLKQRTHPDPIRRCGYNLAERTLQQGNQDKDDQDYVKDAVGGILEDGSLLPAQYPIAKVEKGEEEGYEDQRTIAADPGSSQLEAEGKAGRTIGIDLTQGKSVSDETQGEQQVGGDYQKATQQSSIGCRLRPKSRYRPFS